MKNKWWWTFPFLTAMPFYFIINALYGHGLLGNDDLGQEIQKMDNLSSEFKSDRLKELLNLAIDSNQKNLPHKVSIDHKDYIVDYTFHQGLTDFVQNLLKQYSSAYTSVAIIDNETGNILSLVNYAQHGGLLGNKISFSSTHPSASLFKMITTAELLENTPVHKDWLFSYSGRSTTLFRHQLGISGKKRRRNERFETLSKAFARSNNVIFAKAALENTTAEDIFQMAYQFGLERDLMSEVTLEPAKISVVTNDFELAELASGFNAETMFTPIHAALFASVIANGGVLKNPHIVLNVKEQNADKILWRPQSRQDYVISADVAQDMQEMMELTVKEGTARGGFGPRKHRVWEKFLRVGGKTGSITGGFPFGKRDWFISFAQPKDEELGKGISICVMVVNQKKWYVKSTYLARKIIEYYYKEMLPADQLLSSNVSRNLSGNAETERVDR